MKTARRTASPRPGSAPVAPSSAPVAGSSRRRFLQLVAGASATPWMRAALPALGVVGVTGASAQPSSDEKKKPAEVGPWLAIVRERYGAYLSATDLQAVEENLAWTAQSGTTLRAAALANADEPDIVFRAEPPEVAR